MQITAMIQAIAEAFKEGSKAYHAWLVSRDKRRDEAAIEAAEKGFFMADALTRLVRSAIIKLPKEDQDQYAHLMKRYKHYRKRFFHYN